MGGIQARKAGVGSKLLCLTGRIDGPGLGASMKNQSEALRKIASEALLGADSEDSGMAQLRPARERQHH